MRHKIYLEVSMKLPSDIRLALVIRGLKMVLRPILWYGFFIVVLLKYVVFGQYEIRITHIPVYIALAFILAVPFFLGWIKEAFKVPNYSGRISEIKKTRELVTDRDFGKRGLTGAHYVNILKILTRTKNGRIKKIVHREPSFFDIDYFKVGDEVKHFWGAEYLDKCDKTEDKDILCPVCGEMSRIERETCYGCRRSLLKYKARYKSEDNIK